MFRLHPSFLDLFMILMSIFLIISVLTLRDIKCGSAEYSKVNTDKKGKSNDFVFKGEDSISVNVIFSDNKIKYIVKNKAETFEFVNKEKLASYLRQTGTGKVFVNVQKDIPTGITQEILNVISNQQITPFLAVDQ